MLCIVMEYASGGDLHTHIQQVKERGERIPEAQIWEWLKQMASALFYIHSQRILHRDLKTQNIFLTEDNNIKIGDFGVSKVKSTKEKASFCFLKLYITQNQYFLSYFFTLLNLFNLYSSLYPPPI